MDSPALSVGGPPSVPSRISVVLVEEAKAEGIPCLGCPREDQDMRLLAGVAKPSSGTVCIDSLGSPCVGGDAVFFRHCRETPSGGTCWDIIPGRSCGTCWPEWPVCSRWPRWPVWDTVPI